MPFRPISAFPRAILLSLLTTVLPSSVILTGATAQARRPVFRPIPGESAAPRAEAESLYTTPKSGGSAGATGSGTAPGEPSPPDGTFQRADFKPKTPVAEEPVDETRYFEDLPGVTVTGIPRLARDNHGTEIFFTNVNQSYFIRQDNFHNRRYYVFEAAMKSGASVSFRADPVSRQVLEVDGVDQASAKPKPKKQPASTSGGESLVDQGHK